MHCTKQEYARKEYDSIHENLEQDKGKVYFKFESSPVLCSDQIAQESDADYQYFKIVNFVFWVMRSYF